MGMAAPIYWTREMVRALPEDGRKYETVHGELLVSPAPRPWHEEICIRLLIRFRAYAERERVGHVFASRSDISWSDDTLVEPDLFVVPLEEARTLTWSAMKHLLLAVEVLSPSSARADRFTRRRLYQSVGVPTYWVVDADAREVEIWTPEATLPVVARERITWAPPGAEAPCTIELAELFGAL